MKRRRILQSFVALPAAAAAAQSAGAAPASEEYPRLTTSSTETAAAGVPHFFSTAQLEVLTKLGDVIVPASTSRPSASQAGVPEFLDFLVGSSPKEVQALYREGLDRLAREGVSDTSLAPLKAAWSYAGPGDRFARFLQKAKSDIIQAATSSREWAEAQGRGRRASAPAGYYWRSLD